MENWQTEHIIVHFEDTLALSHTHTDTHALHIYIYTHNAEKHSPTHKHPSVTLIMFTPTAKLCRRHLIPDNSAISWHKPTQMHSHSCTQKHTHTHTRVRKHYFFLLFLLSGSVRAYIVSCYRGKSRSMMCPLLHCFPSLQIVWPVPESMTM